jgi:hypothetical protein
LRPAKRGRVDPDAAVLLWTLSDARGSERDGDRRIYDVRFLLGEFIVSRWDVAALRALIHARRRSRHPPHRQTPGLSTRDFETGMDRLDARAVWVSCRNIRCASAASR